MSVPCGSCGCLAWLRAHSLTDLCAYDVGRESTDEFLRRSLVALVRPGELDFDRRRRGDLLPRTTHLPSICTQEEKDSLRQANVIIKPNNAVAEHVRKSARARVRERERERMREREREMEMKRIQKSRLSRGRGVPMLKAPCGTQQSDHVLVGGNLRVR